MRIGVDVSCWRINRGFGRYTRELFKALVPLDRGNRYTFFTDEHSVEGADFPAGVDLVRVPTSEAATQGAGAAGRRSFADIRAMTGAVRSRKLDLFFFPAVYSYFPILNRTSVVVAIHDLIADRHPAWVFPRFRNRIFWRLKERLAVLQSRSILTVSEHSAGLIRERFGLAPQRVRAVWEAAAPAFRPADAGAKPPAAWSRLGLPDGARYALYVGGISPHKNLPRLIEAFAGIASRPGIEDVKLVLAGDYEGDTFLSDLQAVRGAAESAALRGRVVLTGRVSDAELAWLYRRATVFVLPSLEEGFGLPAVEAMACGAPVAASARGSLPEVIGDAGLFFDPLDAPAIGRALASVFENEVLRADLGRRSLARSGLFSWENTARGVLSFFVETAGGAR